MGLPLRKFSRHLETELERRRNRQERKPFVKEIFDEFPFAETVVVPAGLEEGHGFRERSDEEGTLVRGQ